MYKKNIFFFSFQAIRFSRNVQEFKDFWHDYPNWKKSMTSIASSMKDEEAWITFQARDFLKKHIQPNFRIFEYGGGGSSLFFCNRAKIVVTVENHEGWVKDLEKAIQQKGFTNWSYYFEPGDEVDDWENRNPSNPQDFRSNGIGFEKLSFEKYVRSIEKYPKESFDLILIDGRARTSCIAVAQKYLKKGGCMVVDNAERAYYFKENETLLEEKFDIVLDTYAPLPYTPDFTKTMIFKKK